MTDIHPGDKLDRDCPKCGNHLIYRKSFVSDRLYIACLNKELPSDAF